MGAVCGHLSHKSITVANVPVTVVIRNWDYGTVHCVTFNLCRNETLPFTFEKRVQTLGWVQVLSQG